MQAHRLNDVELILRAESEDYVVGNRGEISHPTLEERRARLGPYLRSTQFTEYIDVVPPIVAVSRDGSLGWVIVQVRARGTQSVDGALQPISFEFAWIELYEKRRGTWLRIGNLSNVKP